LYTDVLQQQVVAQQAALEELQKTVKEQRAAAQEVISSHTRPPSLFSQRSLIVFSTFPDCSLNVP